MLNRHWMAVSRRAQVVDQVCQRRARRRPHPTRAGAAPLLAIPVGNRSVDAEATTGLAANGHMMMVGETGEESPFAHLIETASRLPMVG